MLEEKSHLPAVLQSLGCIAQTAMPIFETRESEIEKFIKETILEQRHVCLYKYRNSCDSFFFLQRFYKHVSLTEYRRRSNLLLG